MGCAGVKIEYGVPYRWQDVEALIGKRRAKVRGDYDYDPPTPRGEDLTDFFNRINPEGTALKKKLKSKTDECKALKKRVKELEAEVKRLKEQQPDVSTIKRRIEI